MKNIFFGLLIFIAAAASAQERGVYINGEQTITQKSVAGHKLDAKILRLSLNLDEDFVTQSWKIKQYKDSGFAVSLTVNNTSNGVFASDTMAYKVKLRTILILSNLDSNDVVAVENEQNNSLFHAKQKMSAYMIEYSAAISVCNELGIPVMDGGMTQRPLTILAMHQRTFLQSNLKKLATQDSSLMVFESKRNCRPNFHYYSSDVTCATLTPIILYIYKLTGKMPASNETGSLVLNPLVLEAEVKLEKDLPISIINSSPEGKGNAISFVNNDGVISSGFQDVLK